MKFHVRIPVIGSFRYDVIDQLYIWATITTLILVYIDGQPQNWVDAPKMSASSMSRRHIPYLSFHKQIVREICRPQKDDLLILAKGLGMRRVRYPDWQMYIKLID